MAVLERDPENWQFQGCNDGSNWTILDTRSGQTFTNRCMTNTTAYRYYRLDTSNNGGKDYGFQLAELAWLKPATSLRHR